MIFKCGKNALSLQKFLKNQNKKSNFKMNISYKWLKEYVDFDMSAESVASALTSVGLEVGSVEEVQSIKGGLVGLVVGEVLTCESHPNSDHMHVCSVNLGDQIEQIVCGAPNVASGQKVIVATLGTKLYDGDKEFVIKKSKLRGIESNGMICAEDEIGIGTSHDGIIVLPADAVVGTSAAEYYGLESDWLIEVDITPNHSDACSHWGVARDFYAYLRQHGYESALHRPGTEDFKVDNHDLEVSVEICEPEACSRYCAVSVTDCEVKESPQWLKDRLTTIGLRPINNIVDITNYIMMAYGQPLHCFDADMITGNQIIVKTYPDGTPFVTLDGVEHKLSSRDLAICNSSEPMCIAGVFGGQGSGTYSTTKNVVFESAYFHPTWIRKSSRRHGIQTDSSFRFERGIDPAGQVYAIQQAALLAKELAGGKISMEIKDISTEYLPKNATVHLDYAYATELIGKEIPAATIKSICTDLGMKVLSDDETGIDLEVPAYRVDVTRPCDIVEEVMRIYGYDNIEIPSQVRSSLTVKGDVDRSNKYQNLISEQLVGGGFNEILNNSLSKISYYENCETYPADTLVKLMNPLSQDLSVMRRTLLFGGLESISHNINRQLSDLRLFEFGSCYKFTAEKKLDTSGLIPSGETSRQILSAYSEDYHLGIWITGNRIKGSWMQKDAESSVYELKSHLLNILKRLGISLGKLVFSELHNDIFSAGETWSNRGGKVLIEYGIVSNHQMSKFELTSPVYFADVNWTELMKLAKKSEVSFREIPKFPAVSRDLALLVDKTVKFADIERIAYSSERRILQEVRLFDVYEGKNLDEGKKSYAVNFVLQDPDKTLADKQIESIMSKIEQNICRELNAKVRGK